jgi:hypothetical protein
MKKRARRKVKIFSPLVSSPSPQQTPCGILCSFDRCLQNPLHCCERSNVPDQIYEMRCLTFIDWGMEHLVYEAGDEFGSREASLRGVEHTDTIVAVGITLPGHAYFPFPSSVRKAVQRFPESSKIMELLHLTTLYFLSVIIALRTLGLISLQSVRRCPCKQCLPPEVASIHQTAASIPTRAATAQTATEKAGKRFTNCLREPGRREVPKTPGGVVTTRSKRPPSSL